MHIDCLPTLGSAGAYLKQLTQDKPIEHKHYIGCHGQDMPEILDWKWGNGLRVPSSTDPEETP